MSLANLLLVLLSEICAVAGQLFFKRAMTLPDSATRAKFLAIFLAGIAVMALNFFLWLGLLSKFNLSFLYPFDALNRILLLLGASVFLREKMTPSLWLGVLLISGGVALVVAS